MTSGGWRLIGESVIAGLFGLIAHGLHAIQNWASMTEHGLHLFTRVTYVLSAILFPGAIVGELIGGALDIGGVTTNWAHLDKIEAVIGTVANCLLFASVWAILRGLPRESRTRRVTLGIVVAWFAVMTPILILGTLFAVY